MSDKETRAERKARKKAEKQAEKEKKSWKLKFQDYPHLLSLKPKEKIVFHSDYFIVDDRVATIMSFFHAEGASDNFGAFWGINRIPVGLDSDIEIVLLEQNRKMTEDWLSSHQTSSEGVTEMNANEQSRAGTQTAKGKATQRSEDMKVIAQEIQNGAAYMEVQFRMFISAPNLDALDDAVDKIERQYIDRFATIHAAAYYGSQRRELSTLLSKNKLKMGKPFYFTSVEYAGAYSLVTHGLEDDSGEYVGYMVGDVNNAAVLFDVNAYGHHAIVADESYSAEFDRQKSTSLWGSKMSQACLLHNHRCIHLVLDDTDLDKLGPKFERLTFKLDLNKGDINMFELFGNRSEQLSLFPAQMQKLILMAEQAYEATDNDRAIIRGSLEEIATKFYVQNRMWYANAKANQERLRVVGIPHNEVPKLEMFVSYLDMEYKAAVNSSSRDNERIHALNVLAMTFKNLLSSNGDLFNSTTNPAVDGARTGRRVIYDFSRLQRRGKGVAMAQLVNIMGFAVNTLGYGDTVFIHGAEKIEAGVKDYIQQQFGRLFDAGGRVVYLYNNIDAMLDDKAFCGYDKSDYMILGTMPDASLRRYQAEIGQTIPADLAKLITNKAVNATYIRRGFDNVVFRRQLSLGVRKKG